MPPPVISGRVLDPSVIQRGDRTGKHHFLDERSQLIGTSKDIIEWRGLSVENKVEVSVVGVVKKTHEPHPDLVFWLKEDTRTSPLDNIAVNLPQVSWWAGPKELQRRLGFQAIDPAFRRPVSPPPVPVRVSSLENDVAAKNTRRPPPPPPVEDTDRSFWGVALPGAQGISEQIAAGKLRRQRTHNTDSGSLTDSLERS